MLPILFIFVSYVSNTNPATNMSTLTLPEVFDLRLKLKSLEEEVNSGTLSLFDRCDKEDEILAIREKLGEFDRAKGGDQEECLHCSG